MTPTNQELIARITLLEAGLSNLINCAECCDGWDSFPKDALNAANDILNDPVTLNN